MNKNKQKELAITILGGGNIGTLLAADIARDGVHSVRILTSSPYNWSNQIEVVTRTGEVNFTGRVEYITDDPKKIIPESDIIISTLPSHVFPEYLKKIEHFIKPGTWLGFMPGSGGGEFYSKELISQGCKLFGFQRVHGIARIKKYGSSVYDLGRKNMLYLSSIPTDCGPDIVSFFSKLLKIRCTLLPNYLNVTLTPSNPILHTSRIYTLFRTFRDDEYWANNVEFYSDWSNDASEILFSCDEELQQLCRALPELDLTRVKSLKEHYESDTPEKLTKKLRSIEAFKNIKAPMVQLPGGYRPDLESRYFLEDFPYGLCIIKGFCEITGVPTPAIDIVLKWYERIIGTEFYNEDRFDGNDLQYLPIPMNFGLKDKADIYRFYK